MRKIDINNKSLDPQGYNDPVRLQLLEYLKAIEGSEKNQPTFTKLPTTSSHSSWNNVFGTGSAFPPARGANFPESITSQLQNFNATNPFNTQTRDGAIQHIAHAFKIAPPDAQRRNVAATDSWRAILSPMQERDRTTPMVGRVIDHETVDDGYLHHSRNSSDTSDFLLCSPHTIGNRSTDEYRPIRQPDGPRDSAKDRGFDRPGHEAARSNNPYTLARSQNTIISKNLPHYQSAGSSQSDAVSSAFQTSHRNLDGNETASSLQRVPNQILIPPSHHFQPASTVLQEPTNLATPHLQHEPQETLLPSLANGVKSQGSMGMEAKFSPRQSALPSIPYQANHFHSQAGLVSSQRPFFPSTMALAAAGVGCRDPARMPQGSAYKGDAFAGSYLHRIEGLPDHLNSGIWIKGLPPNLKHSQLFDMIQCGSVWSLYLKPPTTEHLTVAAQLAFVTPQAAALFMGQYRSYGLRVDGYWASCSYDRFGSPAHSGSETRVLRIEGPAAVMTPQAWDAHFKSACTFQMDRWSYLECQIPGRLRMEFRFSRVDGQAQTCRQMIERRLSCYGISVWYGPDPCGELRH